VTVCQPKGKSEDLGGGKKRLTKRAKVAMGELFSCTNTLLDESCRKETEGNLSKRMTIEDPSSQITMRKRKKKGLSKKGIRRS